MLAWRFNLRTVPVRFARIAAALACVLVTALAAHAEQPSIGIDEWVNAQFHPTTTEVRGIPAKELRKNWCKATELRKELLPKDIVDQNDGGSMYGLSFALEGNFDGSARKQIALVGVYEDCGGKTGHFFAILDQPAAGRPKVRFLDSAQGPHPFAALGLDDKAIIVSYCLECDVHGKLQWDRKRRKFAWIRMADE